MKIHGLAIFVQLAHGEFLSHFNLRLERSKDSVSEQWSEVSYVDVRVLTVDTRGTK